MQLYTVDAFTDRPFAGNPAAVVPLRFARPDVWMQAVATEMNLSETAFLVPREADGGMDLRWFTPTVEVDLCGHATLASAHVLWHEALLAGDAEAVFHTRSGVLRCRRLDGGWIEMDFPATPPAEAPGPPGLADALGAPPVWTGRTRFDLFVRLADAQSVRALAPDPARVAALGARGVVVTAPGEGGYDVVSRFFAPGSGVAEDPVTGSAHCALGPYWAADLGRSRLLCYQASARGGVVDVEVRGERVLLRGQAVTVLKGQLAIDE